MDSYALEAQFTSVKPLGVTPLGLRIDIEFAGHMTDGPLAGKAVRGTDYLLIRPDGVAQLDIREIVTSGEKVDLGIHVLGYAVPPVRMPPLSVIADPGFEWPDAEIPLHGAAFIETADPDAATATATVYACTGTVNVATGTIRVSARAITELMPTADLPVVETSLQ